MGGRGGREGGREKRYVWEGGEGGREKRYVWEGGEGGREKRYVWEGGEGRRVRGKEGEEVCVGGRGGKEGEREGGRRGMCGLEGGPLNMNAKSTT